MSDFHNNPEAAAFGVKVFHVVAGVAGGVVRSFVSRYTILESAGSVIVGGLAAGYGTPVTVPIVAKWLTGYGYTAAGLDGATGFLLGLCGMTFAEVLIRWAKKWKGPPAGKG